MKLHHTQTTWNSTRPSQSSNSYIATKCGLVLLVLPLCFLLYPLSCLPGTLQWKARGLCVKTGQVDLIMFILSYTLLLQPPCTVKYISACVPYGLSCCHNKVVSPLGGCPVLYVSPLLDFTACKKVVPVRKGGRAVATDSTTGCEYHFWAHPHEPLTASKWGDGRPVVVASVQAHVAKTLH